MIPFEYSDLELGKENYDDEYEFFRRAENWVLENAEDSASEWYFLFVTYLQTGASTEDALVEAMVMSGVLQE